MTLPEYIQSNLKAPFQWGFFDCVTFSATWVQMRTGIDPLAGLPKWETERQARRVIASAGGVEAAIDRQFASISPNFARDGDIGMHDFSVGIFSGPHIVCPGPEGLAFIDRTKAKCAWSIS
jgi:hypothetical protein